MEGALTTPVQVLGRDLHVNLAKRGSGQRRTRGRSARPQSTLYIGNISRQLTNAELEDLFKSLKNVLEIRVAVDKDTGDPRGFAHAEFVDVDSAIAAKEELDGKTFHGRDLVTDFAESVRKSSRAQREDRAPAETRDS